MIGTPPLLASPGRPGIAAWLIAAACLLLLLAAGAAILLGRAASGLDAAVTDRLIVQVIEPDHARRDAIAADAAALLRGRPDVAAFRQLGQAEIARLIAPYAGSGPSAEVPVPALIDVTLAKGADAAPLKASLRKLGPIAVEPAGAGLEPLTALLKALRALALAIAAIAGATATLIAILAARTVLNAEAATVAILHGLGGSDAQIARAISGRIARDAAAGAVAGLILATTAILLLSPRAAALGAGLGTNGLGWSGWATLLLLPIALVALAVGAAHATMRWRLARTP